jgi:eukaryotic-like serine/threonine-protein kinase
VSAAPPVSIRPPPPGEGVDLDAVLHTEELSRANTFFRVALAVALSTGAFLPFLSGDGVMRAIASSLCFSAAVVFAAVLWWLRGRPWRYTPALLAGVGIYSAVAGVTIVYYVGVFSAGATILAMGIYFFGMSHSRFAARTSYGAIAGIYLVFTVGVSAGWLPDRSLLSVSSAPRFTLWFQTFMSQVIFALTFWLARNSRRALETAVDRVNRANAEASRSNALLAEAHSELASAQRPGDGRHTGRVMGSFHLAEVIGRGAMGEVYRAKSEAGAAAVKLLHPNLLADPTVVKRFFREAQAAAAVGSKHVPAIFEVGYADDGAPYLAMELLEGHDLGWHLRKTGRLTLAHAVEMCEHVAQALSAVRDAGVVHRDLKPGNIFLTDTIPRTWKVLDFGLSKMLDAERSMTKDVAVGTPSYMAPEQIRGPKVDHLTDLYALAAIAYRAITGSPAFAGDEVAHILYAVLNRQPPAPSSYVPVPVDVELVLAIGMAKERDDRFQSAEELAQALAAANDGTLDDETRARGWALLRAYPWGSESRRRTALRRA